jgi:hypothetical protein
MGRGKLASDFTKRLLCVTFVVAAMCTIAPAAFAAWDSIAGRYNPDNDGMVVAYDTSDCKGNSYIILYHGTTYSNLANWHGADGTQFNDKISCVIIAKHTFFEHWNDANYKGLYGSKYNDNDQMTTQTIATDTISSVKVWRKYPPPSGSYTQSCDNIYYDGSTLKAHCKKKNHKWNNSAKLDNANNCSGIWNDDGTLKCD